MDDDRFEPYVFRTPWLGKQIARTVLTAWVGAMAARPKRIGDRWDKLKGLARRYYLTPLYLIALCIAPFWLLIVVEVITSLFAQLADEPPAAAADKR